MSILSRSAANTRDVYIPEADVIMTATILGFSAARIMQHHPFSFDMENPHDWSRMTTGSQEDFVRDYQGLLSALSALSEVLENNGLDATQLKDAQSAAWEPGALITGLAGGAASGNKHKGVIGGWQQFLREQESRSPIGYCGRGAYTGFIDDPSVFRAELLQPTKRRVILNNDGRRWNPNEAYWGLIDRGNVAGPQHSVNLSNDPRVGMGPIHWNGNAPGVVGYTHGMSWAMREAIKEGPWITPYEIAAGSETTKMASCFACTTYMYAAGYPPSSIHLGRGESWAPLPEEGEGDLYNAVARSMNVRWHLDCYNYLRLGGYMLNSHNRYKLATAEHRTALTALGNKLEAIEREEAGNIVLDALTVHDSDWKRINRALKPATKKSKLSYFA